MLRSRQQPFVLSFSDFAPRMVPADLVDSELPNPGQKKNLISILSFLISLGEASKFFPLPSRWKSGVLTCVLGKAECVLLCVLAASLFWAEAALLEVLFSWLNSGFSV